MSFNHSASNCIKSLLIICSKSAKVTSKQCSCTIFNQSIFSKLFIRLKERSLKIFFLEIFLFDKWKFWWNSFWRTICCGVQLIIVITLAKITQRKPFLFFRKWMRKIGAINRTEDTLPKNVYLCSDHFEEACFNKSWAIQARLLYTSRPQKRNLLDRLVPTIFFSSIIFSYLTHFK